jgi:hypothetical protein
MFRLQTVDPKDATGPVAELFNSFPPQVGVPGPLLMMSASPDIVTLQGNFFKYFRAHERLSFKLQAIIRYLVAADLGYSYCVGFNGNLLKAVGLTDVEMEAVHADLDKAPLEPRELALLKFVLGALRQPEQTQDADIAALRGAGWQDSDIFDALWIGAGMIAAGTLFKALKV